MDYDAWLDSAHQDVGYLLDQFPADRMSVRPVSTYVNNARHEGPESEVGKRSVSISTPAS